MTEQLEPETASKSEMETLSAEVKNTYKNTIWQIIESILKYP